MAEDLADVPEQTVFFSRSTTRPARRRPRLKAMLVPMTPPPMTTTSAVSIRTLLIACRLSQGGQAGPAPRDDPGLAGRNQAVPRPWRVAADVSRATGRGARSAGPDARPR